MGKPNELLDHTAHRPWPLPKAPWVQQQRWNHLLFAHWPVPADSLRARLPPGLELDFYEGQAWLSIHPFVITDLRARGLPPIPGWSSFPEVDVRTYAVLNGKPGVWYFGMYAPRPLLAAAARLVYHMPYFAADVEASREGDRFQVGCRADEDVGAAEWEAAYRPTSEARELAEGTLDHWLLERWAMFTADRSGAVHVTEIHRLPWLVREVEAEIRRNTLAASLGLDLPPDDALLHFSDGADVLIWPPLKAG
jgi:uncharacterized protein YqjF (DUF2071 family)